MFYEICVFIIQYMILYANLLKVLFSYDADYIQLTLYNAYIGHTISSISEVIRSALIISSVFIFKQKQQ